MESEDRIKTTSGLYSFELAGEEKKSEAHTKDELEKIQNCLFDILQNKELSLDTKIADIKDYLESNKSKEISGLRSQENDHAKSIDIIKLKKIAEFVKDQYYTMSNYCDAFLKTAQSNDPSAALEEGSDKLHSLFPDLDMWICKMFVNDIFYTQFPYIGEEMSMTQAGTLFECEIRFLQMLLYSNAEHISVYVRYANAKMGETEPQGNTTMKVDVASQISAITGDDYGFVKWAAFSTTDFSSSKQHSYSYPFHLPDIHNIYVHLDSIGQD